MNWIFYEAFMLAGSNREWLFVSFFLKSDASGESFDQLAEQMIGNPPST